MNPVWTRHPSLPGLICHHESGLDRRIFLTDFEGHAGGDPRLLAKHWHERFYGGTGSPIASAG